MSRSGSESIEIPVSRALTLCGVTGDHAQSESDLHHPTSLEANTAMIGDPPAVGPRPARTWRCPLSTRLQETPFSSEHANEPHDI
jgi:hypothetical protein